MREASTSPEHGAAEGRLEMRVASARPEQSAAEGRPAGMRTRGLNAALGRGIRTRRRMAGSGCGGGGGGRTARNEDTAPWMDVA